MSKETIDDSQRQTLKIKVYPQGLNQINYYEASNGEINQADVDDESHYSSQRSSKVISLWQHRMPANALSEEKKDIQPAGVLLKFSQKKKRRFIPKFLRRNS